MYCKNCGSQFASDEAVVCVNCGVRKGDGNNYCWNCGSPVDPAAQVCMGCGVPTYTGNGGYTNSIPGAKSKLIAGLLGIFLGCFGIHNFYLGYTTKAVIQCVMGGLGVLLSCIGIGVFLVAASGIWGFIEGILVLCGSISVDGHGQIIGE